jgi:hypothetical protein
MKADWQTKDGEPPGKPDFLKGRFVKRVLLIAQVPVALLSLPFLLLWIGIPVFIVEVKDWPSRWIEEWKEE